ncbi:pTP [Falcon aviadenovirus A]|nr:pTP [Falcon aviadenovirus A]
MEPVISTDYVLVRAEPALIHPRSVFLVSRIYDYRLMQLRDLAPGSPNVAAPPYNGLPPPHLLLGYQYMHRVLNDYLFENRVFMQIGYDRSHAQRPGRLYWTCLTDCSYSVNVGQYMRFLDLENFHGTFTQMHHAVLMDRVTADMARVHMRGRGVDVGLQGELLDQDVHGYLSGSGASGLQNTLAFRLASGADADILAAIRQLRVALCHFLFCHYYNQFETEQSYRFLPGSEVFALDNWLTLFVEAFSGMDTARLIESTYRDPTYFLDDPAEIMIRCFISAIAGEPHLPPELQGGAIQLRNRRVTSRRGLRPRDRRGRAITASQLRGRRRRAVSDFIDRLPRTTRRRRPPPPEEEEIPEPMEEEVAIPQVVEEEEEDFMQEILRTILEAVGALQDELSGVARRHELFQFGTRFYQLMLDARDGGLITESFLRKWVLYFFLAEHVASTLYYLYTHFIVNREFRRYVDINTLQVLITGWDVNAQQIFKRIWSEQSNPAYIFETLWERILRDFTLMVERTGQFTGMDEADQQLFLSDIQYRDKSGDIDEVLKQLNLSEELLDSVDISFRIKFRGIVAISTNNRIKANLHQLLQRRNAQRRGEILP